MKYRGMAGEGQSQVSVQMLEDTVEVHSNDPTGLDIKFDRTPAKVSGLIIASSGSVIE